MSELCLPKYLNGNIDLKWAVENGGINAGLLYYRYIDGAVGNPGELPKHLRRVIDQAGFYTSTLYKDRMIGTCCALARQGCSVAITEGTLSSRLAIGLGIASQFENGICLHRIHGFPYMPGSTLKGVTHEYALQFDYGCAPEDEKKRKKAEQDHIFVAVFGAQSRRDANDEENGALSSHRGSVIFFDAVPAVDSNLLEIDVMTPHYGDYYTESKGEWPADYLGPNPISFLTVPRGTRFLLSLAACDYENRGTKMPAREVLNKALEWLNGALDKLGVGGKTSVGYGHFDQFEDLTPSPSGEVDAL